jgi:hypothetical protein
MRKIYFLFLVAFLVFGCIEEFELHPDKTKLRLVVEGVITNLPGPYYIRLTESHTGSFIEPDRSVVDSAKAVMNATIIISDNINQVDTLVPIDINPEEYHYKTNLGFVKFEYDNSGNVVDTIYLEDPIEFRHDRGFYKTKNIIGIPGRTYYLKIISEGVEYNSSSYMPSVPEIDSLGYFKKIWELDGEEFYVPLLYFSEPQNVDNYYLIQLMNEERSRTYAEGYYWRFSILSDEFLPPYVNGINVSLGANPRGVDAVGWYHYGDSMYVALSSLTKEGYMFYKALLQQFRNDGGAYLPAPASPPSNISNGGLGLFRASAFSEKKTKIK